MSSLRFHVADYVVFGLTLLCSGAIGVYHAYGGRQSTTKEYLLASRMMKSIPVALSLLASFMSGITILGVPAEIYTFGLQYWLVVFSYVFLFPSVALIFVPILYDLDLTCSYEYLERRFSIGVRRIGSGLYILYTLLYMAIVVYGPSLALESVTGLPIWVSILLLGIVCTFYTTIGGLRAVIWNDVFQVVVMFGGLLTVMIIGTYEVGGPSQVVSLLKENNRTGVSFSVDPAERTTFWVMLIGGAFAILPLWSVNQTAVQRFVSAKSLKEAQNSVWLAMPLSLCVVSICAVCGAVMFAYYEGCDPKSLKKITSADQMLPYFVLDVIGHLHGLPGVFLACLFSGTLSTLSSGINSLAAVFLEDFIKPFSRLWHIDLTEKRLTQLSKLIAAIFGLITIGLSFLAGSLGTILQSFYQVSGVTGGPVVATFVLGMFTKVANKKGAYIGLFCGFFMGFFIAIGAKIHKPSFVVPRASVDRCVTNTTMKNATMPVRSYDGLSVYRLSPFWYSFYCFLITFIVGLVVSFLWKDKPHSVDDRLLFKWKRIAPSRCIRNSQTTEDRNSRIILNDEPSSPTRKISQDNQEDDNSKHEYPVYANSIPLVEQKTNLELTA